MHDPRLRDTFLASESSKYLYLTVPYLVGNGVDIGSGGWPMVPWAIQVELPADKFKHYTNGREVPSGVEWLGDIAELPFKDGVLDFVHSSHLIEDYDDWRPILAEWDRVLKPGGYMIISVPDHERFRAYVERGKAAGVDCDNLGHHHESYVGELTKWLLPLRYTPLLDRFVSENPQEYSIIGAFRKNV